MKKQIKKFVVLALSVGMLATTVLGASAAFDPVYYAAQNPDVVKALGNSPEMLKLHYEMFGRKEARMSNKNDVEAQLRRLFNEKEYAALYPDVKDAFGADKEMMFQHYIAFGLLEARRPSEKVSQAAAASMKKTVETAMKNAGLAATPGSLEVVAVITGETAGVASASDVAVQQALTQVAEVVAKEVTATVEEIKNPTPAPVPSAPSSSCDTQRSTMTEKALRDAISGNNTTVTLTGDVEVKSVLNINKAITIDLGEWYINSTVSDGSVFIIDNTVTMKGGTIYALKDGIVVNEGKTLKLENVSVNAGVMGIIVKNGATLEMKNCTVVGGSNSGNWAVHVADKVSGEYAKSTVKMDGGSLGGRSGLNVNGNRNVDDEISISNGSVKVSNTGTAMYLAGKVKATVSESNIKGAAGIEIRAGELNITKSSIESTETPHAIRQNNNGTSIDGVPLAVSQHSTRLAVKVTVDADTTLKSNTEYTLVVTDEGVVMTAGVPARGTNIVEVEMADKKSLGDGAWRLKSSSGNTKLKIGSNTKTGGDTSGNDISGNDIP